MQSNLSQAFGETGDSSIDPQYPDPRPGGYKGQLQCGVYKPTNVISFSYGGQEADVPYAYQRRQCNEYMKLGLQGVSFFFASGDAGVGSYEAPWGFDNPETGCLGPNGLLFKYPLSLLPSQRAQANINLVPRGQITVRT